VRGFSLTELVVLMAVIGIMTAVAFPYFLSYMRAQETEGAARELVTLLNQARQLAITRNISHSVQVDTTPPGRVRFCSGTTLPCPGGSVWTGPGTDSNGWIALANRATLAVGPAITFTPLGAATPAGTLQVRNPSGTSSRNVVVSASGRVRTCVPGTTNCP
jgi:Tfp pilus assembly protein FimT